MGQQRDDEDDVSERNDDDSADGSRPPPEPRLGSSAEWAVQKAVESKNTSLRAITIAADARDTGKRIEERQIAHERLFAETMGESPDPVRKIAGSGLLGGVAEILEDLKTIKAGKTASDAARVAADAAEAQALAAVAQAKALGRAQWGTVGRTLATVVGIAGTIIAIWKALFSH